MNLDKLSSLRPASSPPSSGSGSRRLPTALLPVGLLLGFLALFALLFGARLLPALEVRTAPVIALRTASQPASETPAAEGAPPSPPDPTAPGPGPISQSQLLFQSSGWVEPDPYITNVPTLVGGVIKEVLVLEGESVKQGDLLATLIDDDARLDVESAERKIRTLDAMQVAHCAQLPVLNSEMHGIMQKIAKEEALLAELQDAADRYNSLRKGSVPALEVTRAQLQLTRQQAALEEARAGLPRVLAEINRVDLERLTVDARILEAQTDLNRMQLALDRTRIVAPMDGIVLRLHAAPGRKRMTDGDDPKSAYIVELYDPDNLQARIDVPLTEASALRESQPVKLTTDLLPDAKFDGVVTRIVGEADLQRNTLQAKVRILNPDPRLRPEMLVRAEFYPARPAITDSPSSGSTPLPPSHRSERLSLYAPKEALLDLTSTTARAWIVDDHRAQLRDLKVGAEERDDHLLILEGLRPGDKVILPPFDKLKPGKRVTLTSSSN